MDTPPILPTDAERYMLYLLTLGGELQREVLDSVDPADFAGQGLARLWQWAREQPAETVTPMALVNTAARLGTPQYDAPWLVESGKPYPVGMYEWRDIAAEIHRAETVRRLHTACAAILAESSQHGADPRTIADRHAEGLRSIAKGGQDAGMYSIRDLLPGVLDYLQHVHAGSSDTAGVPTGYAAVDEVSPLRPGELTILAARPSVGKSALACNMAVNTALMGWPTAFLSLEMSANALCRRVLQGHAEAPLVQTAREGTAAAWQRIMQSSQTLADVPLTICQPGRLTVSGLRRLCRQCVTQRGAKVIWVDYLQLILPDVRSNNRNRENEVAEVSAAAKAIAMDCGVPVVMLAQLNRSAEGQKPVLSHLRDSGSIEQDADAVWMMDRKREDKSGATTLHVAKNREGEVGGTIYLVFRADITLFVPGTRPDTTGNEQATRRWAPKGSY
jgi:replicative DNA helicase